MNNKQTTNTNSINTTTVQGVETQIAGGSDSGGELSNRAGFTQQKQLLSCLEKLDQILANQNQLERILISQVAIQSQSAAVSSEKVLNDSLNA